MALALTVLCCLGPPDTTNFRLEQNDSQFLGKMLHLFRIFTPRHTALHLQWAEYNSSIGSLERAVGSTSQASLRDILSFLSRQEPGTQNIDSQHLGKNLFSIFCKNSRLYQHSARGEGQQRLWWRYCEALSGLPSSGGVPLSS